MNNSVENSFSLRLKEERKRLGHTQASFAELCNIATVTQTYYENGNRKPDYVYLQLASDAGVDIYYLLKGIRLIESNNLEKSELKLVDNYRKLSTEAKSFIDLNLERELKRSKKSGD